MWPLAFCSLTAPCTDLSDTWPLPPRHLTSPFTVSAVTAPCAPSTSMSVETPWRFRFIQAGALIWYSTICAIPRRLSALTLTVEAPTSTSIRSRLECVACTRTEFWFQALTTTSPPKLSTSSRIPGRTGTVVSDCWAAASVMTAAMFRSTMFIPLGPGGCKRAGPPQQLQLAPHGVGEVLIQIRAAGIGRERPPCLHDRGVDRHQALREHAHRGAVEAAAPAPLLQGALQLGAGGRSSSARARATTRRSSSSVVRHAVQPARWASSAARSASGSVPSMYSESRSVHVSFIGVSPSNPQPEIRNHLFEIFPQRHPRMMELRFRRPRDDPEHVRDLLVLVAFHVVQHEHLARAVGKPPDRLLEIERQLVYHGATRHRVEHILGIVIASPFGAERRAACQDHVDRQAVQPGPERRLAAERAELAPGADEHILRDVVSHVGIDHPARQAVDPRHVEAVQPLERAPVATGGERHVGRFRVPRASPARRLVRISAQCRRPGTGELHVPNLIGTRGKRL